MNPASPPGLPGPGASLRHLLIGLAMFAAVGLAAALTPREKVADLGPRIDLETMIPKQFGDWKVDDSIAPVQISPDLRAALNKIYNQTLARTYIDSRGERIMLSIAYGGDQSDNLQVHLPEGCYRGQGFAVTDKAEGGLDTPFGSIPVARLVATKETRIEPITYWIVVGDKTAENDWDMKKAKLVYALKRQVPDGMLIRISTIQRDVVGAYALERDFADAMLEALSPDKRLHLIGGQAG
jgi:EpsI family protein